ncbi:NADH-quinone oxidoreductase subunit A [bacterium]|nr:NADH-quinone oxidoreductase subunit A [bacterium]
MEQYQAVGVMIIFVLGFAGFVLFITHFLGPKVANKVKSMPYESGKDIISKPHIPFNIHFFLVGILFLVFDLEVVFLIPWAVVFKDFLSGGIIILFEMIVFIAILLVGYVYAWKKGALDWE